MTSDGAGELAGRLVGHQAASFLRTWASTNAPANAAPTWTSGLWAVDGSAFAYRPVRAAARAPEPAAAAALGRIAAEAGRADGGAGDAAWRGLVSHGCGPPRRRPGLRAGALGLGDGGLRRSSDSAARSFFASASSAFAAASAFASSSSARR